MPSSLFDRSGGGAAITAVIDDLVARCAGDARINGKFTRTDVPRLKSMLVDQVTMASGGPATCAGRSMADTHRGIGVTAGEFERSSATWSRPSRSSASPSRSKASLGVLGPMRPEIVEVESAETGTPLPDSYQAAPALAHA
jgi:hemoglobin